MILADGSKMEIAKIYPLDAVFDVPEDVPEEVQQNKRCGNHNAGGPSFAPPNFKSHPPPPSQM